MDCRFRYSAETVGGEKAISYLGIDIGGTKVALRIESDTGSFDDTFRWPAASTVHQDLTLLAQRIRALSARYPGPLRAAGVAMPGICDSTGTVLSWPGRQSWVGLDFADALCAILGDTPIAWADDGDLAALAEAGAANCPDLLYLGIGTGVGGGVVLDGVSWPGSHRGSCEVGHLVVDLAGPRCDCGRHGCVQAIASGPATLRRAAKLHGSPVSFQEFVDGSAAGLPWAVTALDSSAFGIAVAAVCVTELARPKLVVLGGGFAARLPNLVSLVADHMHTLRRPGIQLPHVRPASFGSLSSLRGALLIATSAINQAPCVRTPTGLSHPGKSGG